MDTERTLTLLREFDEVDGVSGNEEPVAALLEKYMRPLTDEIKRDALGNLYCTKKGKSPYTLMITAHMDEIGFIVNDIYPDGRISMMPVGYHNPRMLCNQVLTILTEKNGPVEAVVSGGKPPHQHKGDIENFGYADLKLDVGTSSVEETYALGIALGDIIVNRRGCRVLNGKIFSGKAVDDRSGVVSMVLAAELLKDVTPEVTVCFVGTVQEELGIKGGRVVANVVYPDVALAVDVCIGAESDEVSPNNGKAFLGDGPCIQHYDWNNNHSLGNIVPKKLVRALKASAAKAGVPSQDGLMLCGGTDAAEISLTGKGVVSGGVHIPERYIHTAIGTVHMDDVLNTAKLLAQFALDITPEF